MRKHLPQIQTIQNNNPAVIEPPASAMARWVPEIKAADSSDDTTINIYDVIGEYWGEGVSAKLVASILRRNKGKAVTVNINSPGGDFFEGIAIYNMLREHDAEVKVKVVGLAASAASIIAMAADELQVAETGFLMIHNAWTFAIGNRHDMQDVAEMLEKFDSSMTALYAKRTGKSEKEIAKMMDSETWISGNDAVEDGFADSLLDADNLELDAKASSEYNATLRKVDIALAKQGIPRSERRDILKDLTGKPGAAKEPTPSAGDENADFCNALSGLLANITS